MIYLLFILLLFGLLQSLLELKKDDAKESKWNVKRILSLIYIGVFIFGFIVVVYQNKESNQVNELLKHISLSVTKVDSISNEQLKIISKSLKQSQLIINKSDSIDKELIKVFAMKESLISQYEKINAKLSKQIELETKQLNERAPSIDLSNNDISFDGNDSIAYSLKACIRNLGKRNALINSGCGYVLFFNYKYQLIQYDEIRGNSNKSILEPNEFRGSSFCYFSFAITDYKKTKTESYFAVICLKISYKDIAINKDSLEYFYSGWMPLGGFGGIKDWQFDLAKKWARNNLKFYEK